MDRLSGAGRLVFGIAIAALGVEHVVCSHFPGPVLPIIPWLPASPVVASAVGAALLVAGLSIASNRRPRLPALGLGAFLYASAAILQLPKAIHQPLDIAIRTAVLEPLALGSAALVLAAGLLPQGPRARLLGRLGRFVFAGCAVLFGIDHLAIPEFIASLIPPWFPGALFWTYFTALALIAAGISIAVGRVERQAAMLLGSMFLLWFLFLHIPRLTQAPNTRDPDEWSSAFIALAMCGASWLMVRRPNLSARSEPNAAPELAPVSS